MSVHSTLLGSGVTARAVPLAPMESGLDRGAGPLDTRRDTIDRWSAAFARGDDAEVDRLVRQSRIDRAWVVASGELGAMLGQASPPASSVVAEPVLQATGPLADVTHQIGSALGAKALVGDLSV